MPVSQAPTLPYHHAIPFSSPYHATVHLSQAAWCRSGACVPWPVVRRQCGDEHTDPVFDVHSSTSYHQLSCAECKFSGTCRDQKCSVGLSYAEGSRWEAYEVRRGGRPSDFFV
jgi:hypothetical protein